MKNGLLSPCFAGVRCLPQPQIRAASLERQTASGLSKNPRRRGNGGATHFRVALPSAAPTTRGTAPCATVTHRVHVTIMLPPPCPADFCGSREPVWQRCRVMPRSRARPEGTPRCGPSSSAICRHDSRIARSIASGLAPPALRPSSRGARWGVPPYAAWRRAGPFRRLHSGWKFNVRGDRKTGMNSGRAGVALLPDRHSAYATHRKRPPTRRDSANSLWFRTAYSQPAPPSGSKAHSRSPSSRRPGNSNSLMMLPIAGGPRCTYRCAVPRSTWPTSSSTSRAGGPPERRSSRLGFPRQVTIQYPGRHPEHPRPMAILAQLER